jgi:DNA-binding MurR/RpiR family transcriptional regulator
MTPRPASPLDVRGIEERIEAAMPQLSRQEQRVGEFILDHVSELAVYNSSELAAMSGVSKATVSRLYRRLGFADSQEVREHVLARRSAGTPLGAAGAPAASPEGVAALLASERANLARLLDVLAADGLLQSVVSTLVEAREVLVVGYRNSYPVALHLREQLVQGRPGVRLAPQPGQSLGEELADLGEGDVVVLVGFRRRPAHFGDVVDAVAASGARCILITDPSGRGPTRRAELVIECPIDSPAAFDSYASAMSLVSLVASAVLGADIRSGRARIAGIDAAYRRLGEIEGM